MNLKTGDLETRKLYLIVFILIGQISLAQVKGKLRTLNCENSNNSYECYYNELGTLFKEKLDKETIRILLESKKHQGTLGLEVSFVVNEKGKTYRDFFNTNYNELEGVNDKIRKILNAHVSFVMPLNECYKPVITTAKGVFLEYTVTQEESGVHELQLIPPKKDRELTKRKSSDLIQNAIGRGCKKFIGDNEGLKKCLSRDIQQYVAKNFNNNIINELKANGLKCSNRIIVRFYYNEIGKPEDVQAIATHPLLEKEAIRIVKKLPKVKPGIKNGEPVKVRFMLPIEVRIRS